MNSLFIVNFVGKASPATINQLAAITHNNGGKWLISKVNFIEQQVAAVIKVEIPRQNEAQVKQAFTDNTNLIVQFVDCDTLEHHKETIFQLRLDANDRSGIVNEITHVLDDQGISILDIDCQRVFIADGGGVSTSIFTATMAIKLPTETDIQDVINELESLSEDTRVILTGA